MPKARALVAIALPTAPVPRTSNRAPDKPATSSAVSGDHSLRDRERTRPGIPRTSAGMMANACSAIVAARIPQTFVGTTWDVMSSKLYNHSTPAAVACHHRSSAACAGIVGDKPGPNHTSAFLMSSFSPGSGLGRVRSSCAWPTEPCQRTSPPDPTIEAI